MPYVGDPVSDTMADRIEEKIRELLKTSTRMDAIKVFYRGEPGFVPVKLFPMVVVFLSEETEATGQEQYTESTGMRYYRYDGYVAIEIVMKDTSGLMPDADRNADVPSYLEAKELTQAAFNAIMSWGGPRGDLEQDPIVSFDGKEKSIEMRMDTINNGLARRGDNVTNRGTLDFHLYTRRLDW
jgi:hypothetical protein